MVQLHDLPPVVGLQHGALGPAAHEAREGGVKLAPQGGVLQAVADKAHEHRGHLGPGGIAPGVQEGPVPGLDPGEDARGHGPAHGVLGVAVEPVQVGIVLQGSPGGGVGPRQLGVVIEDHGELLPGHVSAGVEAGGAGAGDDAVLRGPGHRLGVVFLRAHVQEGVLPPGLGPPRKGVEHRDGHGPGHGAVGLEAGGAGAAEEAPAQDEVDARMGPAAGPGHIGELAAGAARSPVADMLGGRQGNIAVQPGPVGEVLPQGSQQLVAELQLQLRLQTLPGGHHQGAGPQDPDLIADAAGAQAVVDPLLLPALRDQPQGQVPQGAELGPIAQSRVAEIAQREAQGKAPGFALPQGEQGLGNQRPGLRGGPQVHEPRALAPGAVQGPVLIRQDAGAAEEQGLAELQPLRGRQLRPGLLQALQKAGHTAGDVGGGHGAAGLGQVVRIRVGGGAPHAAPHPCQGGLQLQRRAGSPGREAADLPGLRVFHRQRLRREANGPQLIGRRRLPGPAVEIHPGGAVLQSRIAGPQEAEAFRRPVPAQLAVQILNLRAAVLRHGDLQVLRGIQQLDLVGLSGTAQEASHASEAAAFVHQGGQPQLGSLPEPAPGGLAGQIIAGAVHHRDRQVQGEGSLLADDETAGAEVQLAALPEPDVVAQVLAAVVLLSPVAGVRKAHRVAVLQQPLAVLPADGRHGNGPKRRLRGEGSGGVVVHQQADGSGPGGVLQLLLQADAAPLHQSDAALHGQTLVIRLRPEARHRQVLRPAALPGAQGLEEAAAPIQEADAPALALQHPHRIAGALGGGHAEDSRFVGGGTQHAVVGVVGGHGAGSGPGGGAQGHAAPVPRGGGHRHALFPEQAEDLSQDLAFQRRVPVKALGLAQRQAHHVSPQTPGVLQGPQADGGIASPVSLGGEYLHGQELGVRGGAAEAERAVLGPGIARRDGRGVGAAAVEIVVGVLVPVGIVIGEGDLLGDPRAPSQLQDGLPGGGLGELGLFQHPPIDPEGLVGGGDAGAQHGDHRAGAVQTAVMHPVGPRSLIEAFFGERLRSRVAIRQMYVPDAWHGGQGLQVLPGQLQGQGVQQGVVGVQLPAGDPRRRQRPAQLPLLGLDPQPRRGSGGGADGSRRRRLQPDDDPDRVLRGRSGAPPSGKGRTQPGGRVPEVGICSKSQSSLPSGGCGAGAAPKAGQTEGQGKQQSQQTGRLFHGGSPFFTVPSSFPRCRRGTGCRRSCRRW